MKRLMMLLTVAGLLLLAGCGQQVRAEGEGSATGTGLSHTTQVSLPGGDYIEISEKLFIAQSNDIYLNRGDYLGKTIRYEGIFVSSYEEETDQDYYLVFRYGPGCCGYDGIAGFEVTWDGAVPEDEAWCEVVGVLEEYDENGFQYIRLALTSLTVLEERGAEYVST